MTVSTLLPFAVALAVAGIIAGWMLHGLHPGQGDRHKGRASRADINAGLGAKAVRKSIRHTRPSLVGAKKVPIEECGVLLGFRPDGARPRPGIYSKLEDCVLIVGPPRQGKTIQLKGNVIQFPGSVVVTSTKLDIINDTAKRRRRGRGPCLLFNPEGLGGVASTLRWNPVAGCGDPHIAIERASYLLSGTAVGGGANDREFWTNQANKVLRAYLFAAARSNASLVTVKRWANNPKDQTPVQLLIADERAPDGWADELTQILGAYDRLRDSVYTTLAQTFDFLGSPGARQVVELAEGECNFDARRFLKSKATLYLIGPQRDYGSVAPLFSALTGLIYETAKRMAEESRSGRLDPPVLFALDEAPNICPVPLHRWTSEAGSRGIPIITCIQSYKQLADVWGETRGAIIWENSIVKMFLPAGSDDETLQKVAKLCGEYDVARVTTTKNHDGSISTSTVMESKPVFALHEIRMLSDFTALVLKGNRKPVTVRIEPFWERRGVKRAEAKAARSAGVGSAPSPRPPTRGGTPVVPTEHGATIIPMPAPKSVDAEVEEQSG